MNAQFSLLQGSAAGKEISIKIYNPAHGLDGAKHSETKKTAFLIEQVTQSSEEGGFSNVETMLLMTKAEARAIASALMGAAAEL